MYIISKNKDYYDGVVGSVGMDKTIVYERETIEIDDSKKMLKEFQHHRNWNDRRENRFLNISYANTDSIKYEKNNFFIVGFCGKLYLGWKFHYKVNVWDEEISKIGIKWKTDIIYGFENAKKFIKTSYWRSNLKDDVEYVINYDPINMFRELKSPIFIYDGDKSKPRGKDAMIINPILKEWEFYKVVDAFTAFTELQMFIGGVLGIGEKEIVEIEDKYKIPQHGFDKWSFRREPSKKK